MLARLLARTHALLRVGVLATIAVCPGRLAAEANAPACVANANLAQLGLPLAHVARRISANEPVKIVAIGSSSTAGAGASSSAASYPSRLEAELKARFPQLAISVLNRGVNGEEAVQMLARFEQAVVAEHPDLVIWQVGTNALLRNSDLESLAATLREGLDRLKALGADVIVIDPQFAPRVIATRQIDRMLTLLSAAAKMEHVGLFHRYALMRYWNEDKHLPFAQFVSSDGLHMNDWGYACLASHLAGAIAAAATHMQTAHVPGIQQR
jgi:lysophospholipase L1-like esterase